MYGETKTRISDSICGLRGSTTVVLTAHRFATVRDDHKIVYLADGKVKAMDAFNKVRKAVLDFYHQAKLTILLAIRLEGSNIEWRLKISRNKCCWIYPIPIFGNLSL
jgi:hypothetical protein